MADGRLKAVATANEYQQGNIAGLDDAMTHRLVASTVMTESRGGDLIITNKQGYVGRYQAGAGWLADAGYVDQDKLKTAMAGYTSEWAWALSGGMTKFLENPGNWKNGLDLQQYKQSAEFQDKAFKINSDAAYNRAMKAGVLDQNDSFERIAGFLKARHIAGYGGAKEAVTGGRVIKDSNGTSNYDYMHDITRNRDGLDQLMSRDPKWQSHASIRHIPQTQSQPQPKQHDTAIHDVYRQGEKGRDIRALQTTLNQLGYRDAQGAPLVADGDFGQRTKHAVETYQRDHGLEVDGIAGPRTLHSLGKRLSKGQVTATAGIIGEIEVQTVDSLKKVEQAPLLSNPSHPEHALYKQALAGVEKLPPNSFKSDQERQNAAASVAFEAKASGLRQIDHVVPNTDGAGLFAVQGRMDDPAHLRLYVDKVQAAARPIEASTLQMEQATQPLQYQQQQPIEREPRFMVPM